MAVIYPARRAIEQAASDPSAQPLRIFPVLWPLWQVEITAQVEDAQRYDLLDSFVTRAVGEAGLDSATALAEFLGVPLPTVHGCVRYLVAVQHLVVSGDHLALTERGWRSLRAGKRLVSSESRQQLLFDRYTTGAFPRTHYEGAVRVLYTPEVTRRDTVDGTRFTPLFARTAFRPEIVDDVVNRPDRGDYNLPAELDGVRIVQMLDAFLPAYLIRTSDGVLAYTAAVDGRDGFLESLCQRSPEVLMCLPSDDAADGADRWRDWLHTRYGVPVRPRRAPNGVWRAALPADAFGPRPKIPLSRLCSYETNQDLFLQLWCDDRRLRRDAMLARALRMARSREAGSRAAMSRLLTALARQYEVDPVTLDDLRAYGVRTGQNDQVVRLDALL